MNVTSVEFGEAGADGEWLERRRRARNGAISGEGIFGEEACVAIGPWVGKCRLVRPGLSSAPLRVVDVYRLKR